VSAARLQEIGGRAGYRSLNGRCAVADVKNVTRRFLVVGSDIERAAARTAITSALRGEINHEARPLVGQHDRRIIRHELTSRVRATGVPLLGVLIAAWAGSGCAGPATPAGLPVEDDFSDCSAGWSTDKDSFVALSCTDGAYRILIRNPAEPQNARLFFSSGVTALSVEADATRFAGPTTISAAVALAYGVGCWTTRAHGYLFLISSAGDWGIEKITGNNGGPTSLAESQAANPIQGLRRRSRLRAVCVGGGAKPTTIAFFVNGKLIAAVDDAKGYDKFPGFGFFVGTNKAQSDVRFDNVLAREPTSLEIRRVHAASRHGSKLCKKAGIRYSGKTAQGAEVCFTLTPDGRSLVETAYSFVDASRCPQQATGTTYSGYPGDVDANGRIDNPDGLKATIRGAIATGVFEDSSICLGKTFAFTATRAP
jgi:hypothetical protein